MPDDSDQLEDKTSSEKLAEENEAEKSPKYRRDPKKDLNITHSHNYLQSRSKKSNTNKKAKAPKPEGDAETEEELVDEEAPVIMAEPGKARPIERHKKDLRSGSYPQHNSPGNFQENTSVVEAIGFDSYLHFADKRLLKKHNFSEKAATMTKKKLHKTSEQFAHLSAEAFRQMMQIYEKDKRDFKVWIKDDEYTDETHIVLINEKIGITQFIQSLKKDSNGKIIGIKHCLFDQGMPFVINQSYIDDNGQTRNIAHVGAKAQSKNLNSVERFDDNTVTWSVARDNMKGTAALKPSGEIIILGDDLNELSILAARNLGAEGVNPEGGWSGTFSLQACLAEDHPLQREYKDGVRVQIGNIVDGASIPGLEPIFNI